MDELFDTEDMTGLAAHVARRDVTPSELLETALSRMGRVNDQLTAIVSVHEGHARRAVAGALPEGPFRGVPFLLKDLGAEARDFPARNGSRLLADKGYPRDSAIVERLLGGGLVIFGRTASPEAGIGPVTEAAAYGAPTRNPWNLTRTPGGSSGGSGAAVAAGIVPGAHGSDGGGSVRIPASNCGLFGFKPTRGRLPDGPYAGEGWAGMAIDGFLTHSVRDQAALLDLCAGADPGAPYWAPPLDGSHLDAMRHSPMRLRIAFCRTSLTGAPLHPDCVTAVEDAAALLGELGHHVVETGPLAADTEGMMLAWCKIVACGTALTIDRALAAKGRPLQSGDIERIAASARDYAQGISGSDYLAAVAKVHDYGRQMAEAFTGFDILLTPTMAEPPAGIGRFNHERDDYLAYRTAPDGVFAYSPFTAAFNASGQPAASVPLHWSGDGLPIGIHLAAGFGADLLLMSLCAQLERARPWRGRRPGIWSGA